MTRNQNIIKILLYILVFVCTLLLGCSTSSQDLGYFTCDPLASEIANRGLTEIGFPNDSAIFYLEKALAIDTMCSTINYHLLFLYNRHQNYHKALRISELLNNLEAQSPQSYVRVGVFSQYLGRHEAAKEEYKKAAELYKSYIHPKGSNQLTKDMHEFDKEICNVLLEDQSAQARLNVLLATKFSEFSDMQEFYDLTPKKYLDLLKPNQVKGLVGEPFTFIEN